jgi:hypothetical protein
VNPLNRLVGERLRINERCFEISGFDIAEHDVVIRAVAVDEKRDVLELSLPETLRGLFQNEPDRPDHRDGESPTPHFQSVRAIHVNDQWFIRTREGNDVGPYVTRGDAESAGADLAAMLDAIADREVRRKIIREFMLLRWARRWEARLARR